MLIGEVAQRSGISPRMLRHYDRIGLVNPSARTSGGYRSYTDTDLRRLFEVESLRSLGLSLKEIVAVIDGTGLDPMSLVDRLIEQTRDRIERQRELLERLQRIRSGGPADWSDVVHCVSLLRGLEAPTASARQQFAMQLATPEGPDLALLVEAMLNEADPVVAASLQWALARAGDAVVPQLGVALDSDDGGRRRRAVEALEKINTALSVRTLSAALGHPDPLVYRRAALAAAATGHPEAIPALVALIASGEDDGDADSALGVLADRFALAEEVDEALGAALSRGTRDQRLRLTSGLVEIPGPLAHRRLEELAHDPDRRVALTAASALKNRD